MKPNSLQLALLLFAALWAVNALGQNTATGTATKITVNGFAAAWSTGTPNCSSTVTTNCQAGYTLTITPPTGTAIVQQIPAGATTYTYTSPTALSYGAYSLSMVTKGSDSTGTVGTSTATVVPATYAPTIILRDSGTGGALRFSFQ